MPFRLRRSTRFLLSRYMMNEPVCNVHPMRFYGSSKRQPKLVGQKQVIHLDDKQKFQKELTTAQTLDEWLKTKEKRHRNAILICSGLLCVSLGFLVYTYFGYLKDRNKEMTDLYDYEQTEAFIKMKEERDAQMKRDLQAYVHAQHKKER